MRKVSRLLVVLVLAATMSIPLACGGGGGSSPSAPSNPPPPPANTDTPCGFPSETCTFTPSFTATFTPTVTPTGTVTSTRTHTRTPSPTPSTTCLAVFADANLQSVIATQVAPMPPYCDIVAGENAIMANGRGVTSLVGIHYLAGLQDLHLNSNSVHDLGPVSQLSSLVYIDIANNSLTLLGPLQYLPSLNVLFADSNQISDLQPLVDNASFAGSGKEVYLANNPLSDTAFFQQIPTLEARGVSVYYNHPTETPVPTDTWTRTHTPSPTETKTSTETPTETDTDTPSWTVTFTPTMTFTATATPTATRTATTTDTPTSTPTDSPSSTTTATLTSTATRTFSPTVTPTGTQPFTATSTDTIDPSITPTMTFTPDGTIVVFNDNSLYTAVKNAVNLGYGYPATPIVTITSNNILVVTSLSAGTASYEGLQYATNLRQYSAGGSTATTITQLSGLTQLTYLNLTNAAVKDLGPLANCPLTFLMLSGSAVTSFAFLSDHGDTLRELVYNSTYDLVASTPVPRVNDMSALGGLTKLERLGLYGDLLTDTILPSSLAALTSLKYAVMAGNRFTSLGMFSGCSAPITLLDVYSNRSLHSLAGIEGLTSLVEFKAHACHVDGNGGVNFSGFNALRILSLGDNQMTSSPSLPVSIREVGLQVNLITNISALSTLEDPDVINIADNLVTDLAPLVSNTHLGAGVTIDVRLNPLLPVATATQIPILRSQGVSVRSE